MPFLSLSLYNFRNLKNDTIDLLAKEVFFVGENGQGKSNFLEALYYSSYGSSFRTHIENEIIKNGNKEMSVRSLFREENETTNSVIISVKSNKKKIEKNGKRVLDRKELINTIPCVLFSHGDLDFAVGMPERRRFFIDQSLSMYDVLYLDTLRRYRKLLKSRNQILKNQKYELLSVYDMQMIAPGLELERKRRDAIYKFNKIFGKLFEDVTGISNLVISYEPAWQKKDEISGYVFPSPEEVLQHFEKRHELDIRMNTTMSGPHRDKIRFLRNGTPFIPQASTGQRRLISLLLRIAQGVFYTQVTGKKPILLMDDVLLELDPVKREKITSLLPEYDQLFCTFLPGEPYKNYIHNDTRIYRISEGLWTEDFERKS
ncbi:MAG: DNA replication and repair protein RecF [Treponema sp.]|nr:DNA replication and repair protein RecF [Treponema sp.]